MRKLQLNLTFSLHIKRINVVVGATTGIKRASYFSSSSEAFSQDLLP